MTPIIEQCARIIGDAHQYPNGRDGLLVARPPQATLEKAATAILAHVHKVLSEPDEAMADKVGWAFSTCHKSACYPDAMDFEREHSAKFLIAEMLAASPLGRLV